MQTRKRATLIGEVTGGGLKPDVEVPASKALDLAVEKATADAARYREKKRDVLVKAFKDSELKIEEAAKLFDQKKNEEGEKMLFTALNEVQKQELMNESSINDLGYNYLGKDKLGMAIAVFRFNVKSHPGSGNAYDSLGEAYLKDGNKKLAKENYEKSLELDPSNDNARKILKDL
jgi:tetratricopeptide (TPR) repeat protein